MSVTEMTREQALEAALRELVACHSGGGFVEPDESVMAQAREALALPTVPSQPAIDAERVAQLVAHRACCGVEHDTANGKLHGYCVVCGVPWPCDYAGAPPPKVPTVPAFTEREMYYLSAIAENERQAWHHLSLGTECPGAASHSEKVWREIVDKCRAHAAALKEGTVAEAAPTYEVLPSRGDGAELEVNGESIALFDPSPMGDALADLVLTLLTAHADEQDRQGHVRRFNATTAPTDEALLELWRDWWRTLGTCRGETPALRAAAEAAYRDAVNAAKETKP
jgi:hypothetical protein